MSKEFYSEGAYLEKHPDWHSGEAPWKARAVIKLLGKHGISPDSVLEIGCGAGEILNQLYQSLPDHIEFTGYDVSPQAISMASAKAKKRLSFIVDDVEAIPGNRHFDLCLMMDVFEHVENYMEFLRIAKGKGKQFIFHIPLDLSAQAVLRGYPLMNKRKNVGHLHYFSKDTALATLRDCGYDICDWEYTGSYIDLPVKTMQSELARFPRKLLFRMNPDFAVRALGGYSLIVLAK